MPLTANNLNSADRQAMYLMPEFLTEAQKIRLTTIRSGQMLFEGRWRDFLLHEGRTANLFKALRNARGLERALLVTVNVLKLASLKCSDLMVGTPPGITAPEGFVAQADAVKRISQNSHIETVLYEGCLTATYESESWLQAMRIDGRVCIVNVPADRCFPLGEQRPDGSYPAAEKMWVEALPPPAGSMAQPRKFLRKEIHAPGLVTNQLYELNGRGQVHGVVPLAAYYGPAGMAVPDDQIVTGVDELLLDFVPNFTVGGRSISDYENIDELVDQFTAAVSQAAGVISKHADPKLGIPEDSYNEDGTIKAGEDAFAFRSKDEIPVYLTWNAEMKAALAMIDNWLGWLLILMETSPSLIGLKKGAAPTAWKQLRLECVNTLAKVSRKTLYWGRFVTDMFRKAHKLECALGTGVRYDFGDVTVKWNDGLPVDESDQINDVSTMKESGLVDRRTGVEIIHGPEAAAQINERLDAEEQAKAEAMVHAMEHEITAPPTEQPIDQTGPQYFQHKAGPGVPVDADADTRMNTQLVG